MEARKTKVKIVPVLGKIYDITHADTAVHGVALPAGCPANTRAIYISAFRIVGTGVLNIRSGSTDVGYVSLVSLGGVLWFRAADGLFHYSLSVANDDWDVYAKGYITG